MITIPKIKIMNILNQLLDVVRNDWQNKKDAGEEVDSWLYRVFNGINSGGFDFYQESVNILINRDEDNSKKLEVRLDFDPSMATMSSIFVNTPSEVPGGENSIGMSMDKADYFTNIDGSFTEKYARVFEGDYELMITSINVFETELIYMLVLCLFISASDTLSDVFSGTFSYTGKQLMSNPELFPTPVFMRVVSLQINNRLEVPMLPITDYLEDVQFNPPNSSVPD
jgi:hypothetical protein